ncbi:MAG: 23S rRNA (guanosine(2251)-2'-O)-methyltransferase RlmB [Deltaproteobacteria bacterium]|nr:23S rRNA (guanosine(2251)-2'-O)-methyltransferase RlmB [Deltaproteobacteria bacterium]
MRIVYGVNPVMEALRGSADRIERILVYEGRADRTVEDIIKSARAKNVSVDKASQQDLERIAGTSRHQGIAAIIHGEFRYRDIEELIGAWKKTGEMAFFLILDSIQDPQNFGSIIRTANAAGVHGIIIPKDRACEVTPTVVKASAGASEHTLIARETNITRAIERLKEENIWVGGIEAGCKQTVYRMDLNRDLAIVVGSEGKGIRRLVMENCDFCISIPMAGQINSLNAAQAAAITMFEARRQRLG